MNLQLVVICADMVDFRIPGHLGDAYNYFPKSANILPPQQSTIENSIIIAQQTNKKCNKL